MVLTAGAPLTKNDRKVLLGIGFSTRGSSSGHWESRYQSKNLGHNYIVIGELERAYLGSPFLSQGIGLNALNAKSRDGNGEVALIKRHGPGNDREYDGSVDARDLGEDVANVSPPHVERIDIGVGVGIGLGDRVQGQVLNLAGKLLYGGGGSHGEGAGRWCLRRGQ